MSREELKTKGGLVLTRRSGEGVYIGQDIYILVTQVNQGQAKIKIVAPAGLNILRDELEDRGI